MTRHDDVSSAMETLISQQHMNINVVNAKHACESYIKCIAIIKIHVVKMH